MTASVTPRQVTISATIEHWPFKRPFHITGHVFDGMDVVVATAAAMGQQGRGEAAGVYYRGETAAGMKAQIDRFAVETSELNRTDLLRRLPPGGARNAIDCALWDLEAKLAGRPVWQLAGLDELRPQVTTYTLGIDTPAAMAEAAGAFTGATAIKIKLCGDGLDAARVQAVRVARPKVWLGVDANQGLTPERYQELLPMLQAADVRLIEQPFPVERDSDLARLDRPIPVAADESVQDRRDLPRIVGLFDVVNIKLDKSGGLTEALAMAREARRLGLGLMVGNTGGTSLAVAPSLVLAQLCDFVDLDGPLILECDRNPPTCYSEGRVSCPDDVWGFPADPGEMGLQLDRDG